MNSIIFLIGTGFVLNTLILATEGQVTTLDGLWKVSPMGSEGRKRASQVWSCQQSGTKVVHCLGAHTDELADEAQKKGLGFSEVADTRRLKAKHYYGKHYGKYAWNPAYYYNDVYMDDEWDSYPSFPSVSMPPAFPSLPPFDPKTKPKPPKKGKPFFPPYEAERKLGEAEGEAEGETEGGVEGGAEGQVESPRNPMLRQTPPTMMRSSLTIVDMDINNGGAGSLAFGMEQRNGSYRLLHTDLSSQQKPWYYTLVPTKDQGGAFMKAIAYPALVSGAEDYAPFSMTRVNTGDE